MLTLQVVDRLDLQGIVLGLASSKTGALQEHVLCREGELMPCHC